MARASSNKFIHFIALAALIAGCGGSQSEPNDPNSIEALLAAPASSAKPSSEAPVESSTESDATAGSGLNKGQEEQMNVALKRGANKAEFCDEVVENCPLGTAEVEVVFDGQKGRVTDVVVANAPFAGTAAEPCIKRAFIGEIVLPFDGDPIKVPFKVTISKSKATPGTKKK